MPTISSTADLSLISPAFSDKGPIPEQYTCRGQNISPPLAIPNMPAGTKSLALIMHDPDAVNTDWVHWLVWNISPSTTEITENSVPEGTIQGTTSFGKPGYGGPCPPKGTGTHGYMFELYALDITLDLPSSATRQQLQQTIDGHIVAQTTLTGLVAAEQ